MQWRTYTGCVACCLKSINLDLTIAHSRCLNVFQVPMMMLMLIDMIAWAMAQMLMDGMSESAESRLVFF